MGERVNVSWAEKTPGSHRLSTASAVLQGLAGATGHCLPAFPVHSWQAERVHSHSEGTWPALPLPASHPLPSRPSAGKQAAAVAAHGACLPSELSCGSRAVPASSYLGCSAGGQCVPRVRFRGQTSAFICLTSTGGFSSWQLSSLAFAPGEKHIVRQEFWGPLHRESRDRMALLSTFFLVFRVWIFSS